MTDTPSKPLRATKHCRHYSYRNTGLDGFRRGDPGGPQCTRGCDVSGRVNKCWPDPEPGQVCPACKTGTVQWVRAAYNGHCHAACSTPNCFAVME